MGRSKSTHPWAGTPCFLEPSKKKMPALESGPWWGSQLSKAWSAGHCIVPEGAFRVIGGQVALELLGVHAAHLEAEAPAGESWLWL